MSNHPVNDHPVRRYRRENGLSAQALGRIVGVSKVTISQIENRRQLPSLALVQKFVDLTGLRADDFLRQDEAAE